jgi:hypothetical protein
MPQHINERKKQKKVIRAVNNKNIQTIALTVNARLINNSKRVSWSRNNKVKEE